MGGSLEFSEIQSAVADRPAYKNLKNFVESGTYRLDTTLMASKHYDNVYSVEICKELYDLCVERKEREGADNIHLYFGDSLDHLHDIMPKVLEGSLIFLDSHISGRDSSWNGKQLVPLIEELELILSYRLGPSVFILDDLRFWKHEGQRPHDWAHISTERILDIFRENDHDVLTAFEQNDRLYVLTR